MKGSSTAPRMRRLKRTRRKSSSARIIPSTVLSCMPRSLGRYGADAPSRRGPCADRSYTVGRGDATVKRRLLSVLPALRRRVRKLSSNDREARRVLTAMKTLLAALIGLAIAAFASPATAFVAQIATSIPAASLDDDAQLQQALGTPIDDVLQHAIAFAPTVLMVQSARVVGDRVYILLLVADSDGEKTIDRLSVETPLFRP